MTRVAYEKSFVLPHPTDRVLGAWTSASLLRAWFAEHARVDAREGGEFLFWGRHTPWVAAEADADARFMRFDAASGFEVAWRWRGIATRLSVDARGDAGACRLVIRHELDAPMPEFDEGEQAFVLEDFWGLAMGNLREYLKTGKAALRPDLLATGDVVLSIEIDAPKAIVWKALTDPAQMDKWISTRARVDLRPGGEYTYGWTDAKDATPICARRIIAIEPGTRLHHDWHNRRDTTTSTIWELTELSPTRTRLTVRQVGVSSARERNAYSGGWGKFLLRAKALLEGLEPW